MSQKKCPKCGEMNPPEAVMCWACYTPLSGSAPSGSTATSQPSPSVRESDGFGKKAVAPWQIGVVVAALVLGLGVAGYMMFGGGDTEVMEPGKKPIPGEKLNLRPGPPMPTGGGMGIGQSSTPQVATNPSPNSVVPQPVAAQYKVTSAPNPKYNVGTMAIVLSDQSVSSAQEAAAIAAGARQQAMSKKKWVELQIYVFADDNAGRQFRDYQKQRKGAQLETQDYQNLASLWPRTVIRYDYNRGTEGFLVPNQDPQGWWANKPTYTKVQN